MLTRDRINGGRQDIAHISLVYNAVSVRWSATHIPRWRPDILRSKRNTKAGYTIMNVHRDLLRGIGTLIACHAAAACVYAGHTVLGHHHGSGPTAYDIALNL
jgi:hypothetical protein